jgi:hypothetical protein
MTLPVAARELRVAAHDRASYRGRVWMGGIAIFVTIWIAYGVLDFTGKISGSVGAQIFSMQAWAAFAFACCAMNVTADSISREKRDGTLGLLFLTHLKGRDVVLGKLCSGMALYFAGALAALPILTLPVLLGGIQLSQSIFLFVSVLNCMLFSASAGLFASSICTERNQSASLAISIVLVQCVLLPVASYGMLRKGYDVDLCIALGVLSPYFALQIGQGALLGFEQYLFAVSLGIVFLFSLLFLGAAAWITPRSWQVKQREPLLVRLRNKFGAWSNRTIRSRSPLGRQLLDRNAYEWLAARRKSASINFWEFLIAMVFLCTALILNFVRHNDPAAVLILVCLPGAYILQLNCKMRIGAHACARFTEDRDCNAIELILSTPLTLNKMVAGEFRALRRHFLVPLLVTIPLLFAAWYLCLGGIDRVALLSYTEAAESGYHLRSFIFTVAAAIFLILDSWALAWMATWISLSVRKTIHARPRAMVATLFGPLMAFGFFVAVVENSPLRPLVRNATPAQVMGTIALFVLVGDLLFIRHCRKRLREQGFANITNPMIHSREFPSPFAILTRLKKLLKGGRVALRRVVAV